MPVDLTNPLAWKTASGDASAMLGQLQPNILKGHVREHLRILLVQFSDKAEGRAFLKAVGGKVKSAKKHLDEVEKFVADGTPGTPYVGVGLTFAGYKLLGIAQAKIPASPPFVAGMRSPASRGALADPPVAKLGGALPPHDPRGRARSATPTRRRCSRSGRHPPALHAEGQAARRGDRPRPAQRPRRGHRALRLHRRPQPAAVSHGRDRRRGEGEMGSGVPARARARCGQGRAEPRAALRQLLRPAQARAERARLPQGRGRCRHRARPHRRPTASVPER